MIISGNVVGIRIVAWRVFADWDCEGAYKLSSGDVTWHPNSKLTSPQTICITNFIQKSARGPQVRILLTARQLR